MGLRSWVKRLEYAARGDLESFELLDGSRYYFDPASGDLFVHWIECSKADSAHDWPEPPEVVRKLTEAKDVARAIEKVRGGGWNCLVYDEDVLITERRLEPRGLVAYRDPETGEWHIQDPYDQGVEDLSA